MTRKILIADDNKDITEIFALLLRNEGHEVEVAHDGLRAFDVVRDFSPALALIDIQMPELDGYAVARAIRSALSGPAIRLIAVTGWLRIDGEQEALEAGFDEYWLKPNACKTKTEPVKSS